MGMRGRVIGRLAESRVSRAVRWVDDCSPIAVRRLARGHDPIRHVLSKLGRGTVFVQVGANDGRSNDPIFRQVRWADWRGVAVEAVPNIFERLAQNYRKFPQVVAVCAAVGATSGDSLPFYYVDPKVGDPFYADRVGSFRREHVLMHPIPDIERRIKTCMVVTITMDELIKNYAPDVQLIHTDAEGYDEELIPTIDLARWPVHTILFETAHMSDVGRIRCESFLRSHRFKPVVASPMEALWRRVAPTA